MSAQPSAWPPNGGPNDHLYARPQPTVAPSLQEIREYKAWVQTQPANPPPTWDEYQLFRAIVAGGPGAGGPATMPSVAQLAAQSIDPQLGFVETLTAMAQDIVVIRAEMEEVKRKQAVADDGEADDEGSSAEGASGRRKRKKRTHAVFILCAKNTNLSREQAAVKEDLRRLVKKEMEKLTGLKKNPFPFHPGDATVQQETRQSSVQVPTQQAPSGGVAPEHSATGGQDPPARDEDQPSLMAIEWTEAIDSAVNALVWRRASLLVYKDQITPASCTLSHHDIEFTQRDIEELAKVTFRSWKKSYNQQNADPAKRAQREHQMNAQRRVARQRTLKEQRKKGIKRYLQDHPGIDPSCLLRTPWMSEAVSDWSDADEETRLDRRKKLAQKSGQTLEDLDANECKVLERVPLEWRSRQLTEIYGELDQNIRTARREKKRTAHVAHPRVDLGRVREELPTGGPKIYPFMISRRWISKDAGRENTIDEAVRTNNPSWYQPPAVESGESESGSSGSSDESPDE